MKTNLKTLNEKNHQALPQKFRQLTFNFSYYFCCQMSTIKNFNVIILVLFFLTILEYRKKIPM